MKIIYLYHSGFALQFKKISVVIDYYSPHSDKPEPALAEILADPSHRLYVLASHAHHDHFDPCILDFERSHGNTAYVLSRDIAAKIGPPPQSVAYIGEGESHDDGNIRIRAFGSTDEGISFLIHADGRSIFHAGDLNNWHWNEECPTEESSLYEANYLAELEKIAAFAPSVDVSLFPVDPRLGKDFARGAEQFVARIKTTNLIPMHFGTDYGTANSAKTAIERHGTRFHEIHSKGQVLEIYSGGI